MKATLLVKDVGDGCWWRMLVTDVVDSFFLTISLICGRPIIYIKSVTTRQLCHHHLQIVILIRLPTSGCHQHHCQTNITVNWVWYKIVWLIVETQLLTLDCILILGHGNIQSAIPLDIDRDKVRFETFNWKWSSFKN